MLVIGATAIPEHRIISITKGSTVTEYTEYYLDVLYEGAGGEQLEKRIEYKTLAALDHAFKTATGDHEAKDIKFYKNFLGGEEGHTYKESMSGARKTIRIGDDKKLHDVKQVMWRVKHKDVTKLKALDEIENLIGSY